MNVVEFGDFSHPFREEHIYDQLQVRCSRDIVEKLPAVAGFFEKYENDLKERVRYERYICEESYEQWVDLLGDDVLWYGHPFVTAEIAQDMLSHHENLEIYISPDDRFRIFTACFVHDFGELEVGDKTFDAKNSEDELFERDAFLKIVDDLSSDAIERMYLANVYDSVVVDAKSSLGEIFNVVERIGYLNTAVRAFVGVEDGSRIQNYRGLCGNVLQNQILELLKASDKYPYVTHFLYLSEDVLTDMFSEVCAVDIVPLDNCGLECFDVEKVRTSSFEWYRYLRN